MCEQKASVVLMRLLHEPSWAVASLLAASLAVSPPAPAMAELAEGAAVFELKCAACHQGGGNVINPLKGLQAATLKANGYTSDQSMIQLVSNGKGQMPSYGPKAPPFARLTEEQIADVVKYVQDRAQAGWPAQ